MGGGQLPLCMARLRTSARCCRLSYGQTWMISFSGPTSVCQNAPSGENFSRAGRASPKIRSHSAALPGFKRYVRTS